MDPNRSLELRGQVGKCISSVIQHCLQLFVCVLYMHMYECANIKPLYIGLAGDWTVGGGCRSDKKKSKAKPVLQNRAVLHPQLIEQYFSIYFNSKFSSFLEETKNKFSPPFPHFWSYNPACRFLTYNHNAILDLVIMNNNLLSCMLNRPLSS